MAARSRSAKYYAANPAARRRKASYDTAYHDTPARRRYRAELARQRRKRGIMGKGGRDVSHTKKGGFKLESSRRNRARNGSGGRPKKA